MRDLLFRDSWPSEPQCLDSTLKNLSLSSATNRPRPRDNGPDPTAARVEQSYSTPKSHSFPPCRSGARAAINRGPTWQRVQGSFSIANEHFKCWWRVQ